MWDLLFSRHNLSIVGWNQSSQILVECWVNEVLDSKSQLLKIYFFARILNDWKFLDPNFKLFVEPIYEAVNLDSGSELGFLMWVVRSECFFVE
jgi:hypothetical protein